MNFEQWWDTKAKTPAPDTYKNWEESCRQAWQAAQAAQPCDAGPMCLGCTPKGAHGECLGVRAAGHVEAAQPVEPTVKESLADQPVATVRVTHGGYGMELSTHAAYALPEGRHNLYAAPNHHLAAMRQALEALEAERALYVEYEHEFPTRLEEAIIALRAIVGDTK